MSSILDALKKADREAAAERSRHTPWSSGKTLPTPNRKSRWQWWVGAGLVAGLAVVGLFYLRLQTVENHHQQASVKKNPAPQQNRSPVSNIDHSSALPALPPVENAQRVGSFSEGEKTESPKRSEGSAFDSSTHKPEPDPFHAQPQPITAKDPMPGSIAQQPEAIEDPAPPPPETVSGPGDKPKQRFEPQSKKNAALQEKPLLVEEKNFKKDPRIDLQALVWAMEAGDRFVVINNQLIREGGTIDNIVIEKINPDDVKLAEGSNKWYEAFQIR